MPSPYRFYAALLCAFLLLHRSHAQTISDAAIRPDTYENVTARIQKVIDDAIRTGKTSLTFPKARYDFWPDGAIREQYFISNVTPKPGNILTVRDIIRDQVGMHIRECKNVTLEDVGMHYMHGLGIVSQYTATSPCAASPAHRGRKQGALSPQSRNHTMLWFNGCSEVEVSGLKLEGAVLGRNVHLENMPKSNMKVSGSPKLIFE